MIGKYLKRYRLEHNLSQNQMAEKLETSQPYYNALETGRMKPGIQMINRISKLLKLEPSFIRTLL